MIFKILRSLGRCVAVLKFSKYIWKMSVYVPDSIHFSMDYGIAAKRKQNGDPIQNFKRVANTWTFKLIKWLVAVMDHN
jgi:hypothetical protein